MVEFLLLDPRFPRSVRFCVERLIASLEAIEGPADRRELGRPDKLLGMMLAEVTYRDVGEILADDLHSYLLRMIERVGQVSRAVQERYALR